MLCSASYSLVQFVPKHKSYGSHLVSFMQAIYRYYNSAPNISYMFQFTAPYGLKTTAVISLLKLILIE